MSMTFRYEAARSDGGVESGVLQASDRESAAAVLTGRGLFPFQLSAQELRGDRRTPIPLEQLALGLRMLSDFLESGISMSRSLTAFGEMAPASWRSAVPAIRERVREGRSFSAALADAPVAVPEIVLGMIRSGEASGELGASVRRAAELMESEQATRSAIRSALAYPALLGVASFASVALLVGVVLPRFAGILDDLGQALPRSTQIVLAASAIAHGVALPTALLLALSVVLIRAWCSTEEGEAAWHGVLLRIPADRKSVV